MNRTVNYDSLASDFDKRYERSDYSPLSDLLRRFIEEPPSGRVLEVGCGTGHWLAEISQRGIPCFGLDPALSMLEVARRKATGAGTVQAVAEKLPWASKSFTHVICINAFHHMEDREQFLAEAQRVLRPGGRILVVGLDPHAGMDSWWIYDYFPQVIVIDKRRYASTQTIRDLLDRHGFIESMTVEALHFPDKFPARLALATGRLAKSTTSQLAVLPDEEYEAGMARLKNDIDSAEARGETLTIGADLRLYATTAHLTG